MVAILKNSTLKFLNASHTSIQTAERPIYCPWNIIPQLETIDVSNNNIECINSSYFNESVTGCNWTLKVLNLNSNRLGEENNHCNYDRNNSLTFLKPLKNLQVLHLASNILSKNNLNDLKNLVNLQLLSLSSNGLHEFNLNLDNMVELTRLNLEDNNLKCLSRSSTLQVNKLQKLKQNGTRIKVDLSGNLLSCNCECFGFFQWMRKTDVILINSRNYHCEFEDGRKESLKKLSSIISELSSQCHGKTWLKVNVLIEIFVWLIISLNTVSYRRRHDLKYIFLKMKLNRYILRKLLNQRKYIYSAFVSCEHRDAKYFVK